MERKYNNETYIFTSSGLPLLNNNEICIDCAG